MNEYDQRLLDTAHAENRQLLEKLLRAQKRIKKLLAEINKNWTGGK